MAMGALHETNMPETFGPETNSFYVDIKLDLQQLKR